METLSLEYKHTRETDRSHSIASVSLRRPPSKRVVPLLPPHALFKRRSSLLPLLIQRQLVPIPTLTNDIDLDVLLNVRVEAAAAGIDVVAGPRLAAVFHVGELHDAHDALFALAERHIRHGVRAGAFGGAVARVVAVRDQALGAVGRVSVFVRGAHRAEEVADAGAEDYGEEGVHHREVGGDYRDEGFADGPGAC